MSLMIGLETGGTVIIVAKYRLQQGMLQLYGCQAHKPHCTRMLAGQLTPVLVLRRLFSGEVNSIGADIQHIKCKFALHFADKQAWSSRPRHRKPNSAFSYCCLCDTPGSRGSFKVVVSSRRMHLTKSENTCFFTPSYPSSLFLHLRSAK